MSVSFQPSLHTQIRMEAHNSQQNLASECVRRATRIALQVLAIFAGVICLGVGLTLTPFFPILGLSATAGALALFGTAGFFLSREFS